MRHFSRCARQYKYLAIALLVGCEVATAFDGLLLGANALTDWSSQAVMLLMLTMLGVGVGLRWWATYHPPQTYMASRWQILGALLNTYMLFILLGAQWGQSVTHPSGYQTVAYGSQQVVMRSDTLIKPGNSTKAVQTNTTSEGKKQESRRFGYFMLSLIGLGLMFLSLVLACSLACTNSGFLAVVVLMLGLGAGAGGIFFVNRVTDKPTRRWQDIPKPERLKMACVFWRTWLFLAAIAGGLLVVSAF